VSSLDLNKHLALDYAHPLLSAIDSTVAPLMLLLLLLLLLLSLNVKMMMMMVMVMVMVMTMGMICTLVTTI